MAWMSQEKKKQIKVELDKILKGKGFKYSLGVRHHSTLVLNIWSGPIDFISNYNNTDRNENNKCSSPYMDVNVYWYKEHFTGEALELLKEIMPVLNAGNHDNSDLQTDYFDVGWYVDVNIGKWDKPYQFIKDWALKDEGYNDTVPECPILRRAF